MQVFVHADGESRHHLGPEQVAPSSCRTASDGVSADLAHELLDERLLVPLLAGHPEGGHPVPPQLLHLSPEELDAVQVWPVRGVPNDLNVELFGYRLRRHFVDAGIVQEYGQLVPFLVLAVSCSQPPEEVDDVVGVECLADLVHLAEAAALLGDGCKHSDVFLAGPAELSLQRLS